MDLPNSIGRIWLRMFALPDGEDRNDKMIDGRLPTLARWDRLRGDPPLSIVFRVLTLA
jgi:hypothetical protein